MIGNIFVGLLCLGIGLVFGLFGYSLTRIMVPMWAFFAGVVAASLLLGNNFIGWIGGVMIGLGAAYLSYNFLIIGLWILGASFGASLAATVMIIGGFGSRLVATVAVVVGIALGLAAPFFRKPLVVVATSLTGASLVMTGALFILPGGLNLGEISLGEVVEFLPETSIPAFVIWIALSVAAVILQYRLYQGIESSMADDEPWETVL